MRILFCNYEYPPLGGGGGVINALVAQELAQRHQVTVLTSQGPGLPPESDENGVRVVRAPVLLRKQKSVASFLSMLTFLPAGIRAGKLLLSANRFDVINTHFVLPSGPVGDALGRTCGLPNVLSLHGGDLYDPSKASSPHRNPLLRAWVRQLLRRADVVVGQSSNTIANMHHFYTPEIEAERIPLGIRRPPAGAAPRSAYGFRDDEVLLVTIGRLVARKGLGQLIALLSEFRERALWLLIIGSGPQEQALRMLAREYGVADRVVLLGQVAEAEKFRILQMADIYVSTSQHEGFGIVFLEAMACGLPIVCYDHGGQTDFLRDGETGYVIGLNNLELFRQRCEQLIGDAQARRAIGAHNRRRVEEFYIDRCAQMYERVFDRAIARRAQSKQIPILSQ